MMRLTVILLPCIVVFLTACNERESTQISSDIPKEVISTWDSLYPGCPAMGSSRNTSNRNDTTFTLSYELHGLKREMVADKNGTVLELRLMESLPLALLPDPVRDTMAVLYPGVKIEAARRQIIRDTCTYQLLIDDGIDDKKYASWLEINLYPNGGFIVETNVSTNAGKEIGF